MVPEKTVPELRAQLEDNSTKAIKLLEALTLAPNQQKINELNAQYKTCAGKIKEAKDALKGLDAWENNKASCTQYNQFIEKYKTLEGDVALRNPLTTVKGVRTTEAGQKHQRYQQILEEEKKRQALAEQQKQAKEQAEIERQQRAREGSTFPKNTFTPKGEVSGGIQAKIRDLQSQGHKKKP